ncbi:MAG TPA: two-component system response regulator [Deltaproteobacteria bacterium]|nr:MAG: two-component system response regulator [Deltaproteobacteria bacterium GWA2_55_82]OGQ64962.1 MAG: two-component system response regulator [Deltaproteobacteria bacterium RIFCSPLOWO2_02_FULL_55_12]OIJ73858.1 MAG: two-component system response regulator [Deltaproteobacteria bacterium GWC2_55_46]HBG46326.1 two-component system response regulator [Deltaproteobacteria bacterium]HCY09844.1 two-component system response regulator [Deltaproteobacteria bacterium]
MSDTSVLIADDDESILWVLEKLLKGKGLDVVKASDGEEAWKALSAQPVSLAILDINMPGRDGLKLLTDAREAANPATFIIMTAESSMKNTLEAMKLGAFDYVTKPFDVSELEIIIERAIENLKLKGKVSALKERMKERLEHDTTFIGKSKAVEEVFKKAGKVAAKDVTVLVLGESGTGKELLSRLIHMNSSRADGPFVAVNSAAVPKDLMESELFGFEKGAFTGAVEGKKGKFELADGGTLFLDEVGDMSLDLQSRLLRAIQEKEFYRVGGREPIKVDVRIVAATNQDLDKAVAEKRFRDDLLFRLNGITLTLPPLRDRKGDVGVLAEFFLDRFRTEFNSGPKSFSPAATEALEAYQWPGNVRELENTVRRSVLMSPNVTITPQDLNLPLSVGKRESLEEIIAARLKPFIDKTDHRSRQELYDFIMPFMERPLIKLVLEKTRGNQVQAADMLGINRNTLRKKIRDLNINIGKLKD